MPFLRITYFILIFISIQTIIIIICNSNSCKALTPNTITSATPKPKGHVHRGIPDGKEEKTCRENITLKYKERTKSSDLLSDKILIRMVSGVAVVTGLLVTTLWTLPGEMPRVKIFGETSTANLFLVQKTPIIEKYRKLKAVRKSHPRPYSTTF